MRKFAVLLTAMAIGWMAILCSEPPIYRPGTIFRPESGIRGAVVAAEPYAAQAGLDVLKSGGNAIDASVTVGFCLAVTLPRAGNIGGGGFLVYHDAATGQSHSLDYRETAPGNAHRDMFLDEKGQADPELSRYSNIAIGVPGTVAGLLESHRRFGSLPLQDLMAPAIRMAREGVIIHSALHEQLLIVAASGKISPVAKETYLGTSGQVPAQGELFRQPKLADTLERIAQLGRDGFYRGLVARDIEKAAYKAGRGITVDDLASYQPVWREPITGNYRGHRIISMPPPSSGGVHLVQMLQLLENFDLRQTGQNSAQTAYVMIEVMKRAYADRSKFLGDPDFSDVPVAEILSEGYEQAILKSIRRNPPVPVPSSEIGPGNIYGIVESPETTHFSIVDAQGNAVSNTYTLNFSFGSGIMTEKTGILLNNELDDFSAKPGVPNAYGLIGGKANAVEPGKRPLSSMTPTIILKDGKVFAVTGSPGGSRIITTVLQVSLNLMEFGFNAAEANVSPRFHHQWLPDVVQVERGFPFDTRVALKQLGYTVEINDTIGSAMTVVRDGNGFLYVSADPRRTGGTALVY